MATEDFVELTTLRDEEKVVLAVITYRNKPTGGRLYSYSFMREFDKEGSLKRTCWLNDRHAEAVSRLLPRVLEYIEKQKVIDKATRGY